MSYRIRCCTLFDITKTGIINRRPPSNGNAEQLATWEKTRNTQCNYDTILQVVSLRSQPENIADPVQEIVVFDDSFDMFGFLFDNEEVAQLYWSFEFDITHKSVFDDGINKLGHLYSDCDGVPMIKVGTEWDKLPSFLDTSPELRNIYFEVINEKVE
jgi:hypothetical protein